MTPGNTRSLKTIEIPAPAATLLALALSLFTSGVLVAFTKLEHVNNTTVALIFLLPVGISATMWGLLPGIAAASASFLSFNFFFIPDLYTFRVKKTEDLIVLAAFLSVAFVISELAGRVRRNLASATAREHEAMRLYEFNTLLAGIHDEQAAARTLLENIDQTLRPNRIEILIEKSPKPVIISKSSPQLNGFSTKPFVVPLQTARELIGEIRLWSNAPLLTTEERLLKIFASQGVLAIERIRLAEDARKTRILEESDRLKTSLLSSVSHELRSPLAAIKASVSSLRSRDVEWESEARTELLTTIEEEIDHLNTLVGNLLDMSRIEAGVLKPQRKPDILAEIVGTVISRMRPQLQNYQLIVDVPDELPLVNVDFVQIQQVFTNLLTNSLKYSPTGSSIRITAKQKNARFLLVTLSNQSIPVPSADLERIFDKFYRINPSDQVTGAGLGLSICKGIIEAHEGAIWAKNLSEGLAFNLTLTINQ